MKTVIVAILIGVAAIGLLWWIVARARARAHDEEMRRRRVAKDRARTSVSEYFNPTLEGHGRGEDAQPRRQAAWRRRWFGGGGGGGPRPQ
jgi:type II secretory pathway pseudopilin PulG